jgi:putative phosphoribosyl transferase
MTQVTIPVDGVVLDGDLRTVDGAAGVVVFAHGSGSSRLSPRNQAVARGLRDAGFATLLFDLLTAEEGELDARTRQLRFDIDLLSRRLAAVGAWVGEQAATSGLPVAYFGASTGAAAALRAAAAQPDTTAAVISRGGRPDLAAGALPAVRCPTLLLVGGADEQVLELNRRAAAAMQAPVQLEVVPGATHLFEEPGALEAVTAGAASFLRDLLTDAP